MSIGRRIKEQRVKHNYTQEYVAEVISSTKQAIYKYENEVVTNIPMDKIEKLALLFNVSPSYLMGWDEKNNSPSEDDLSEGERMLLDLFRRVPEDKQALVLQMIRVALESIE